MLSGDAYLDVSETDGNRLKVRSMEMNMRITGIFATALVVGPAGLAMGHGSMKDPVSRVYSIYLEGPKSPDSEAARAAVSDCGPQSFYDWNELVNFFPGDAEYQANVPYEQFIPDGRLASADNDKYSCMDLIRDDWPATQVQAGPRELVWFATTPHNPGVFRAWLTTDDWNATDPLNWGQMVELEVGPVSFVGQDYRFETILPERSGRHVLYVIWQRQDPVGEGFYAACDVIFGDIDADPIGACCIDEGCQLITEQSCSANAGEYNGDNSLCAEAACDGGMQGPDSVSVQLVNDWGGGYEASMTITNSIGDLPMIDWELTFDEGPGISSIWNAIIEDVDGGTVIRNEFFNGYLEPGESATFGFIVNDGAWPPSFVNAELNGMHAHIEGADHGGGGHDPCPGDLDGDMAVGVEDLLAVLSAWGTMDHDIDVDGDMMVGVNELLFVVSKWGECG